MKEWMIRFAAGLAALVLVILFFVSPSGEEDIVSGSVNEGRSKYQLAAGETVTWTWTPEEEDTTEVSIRVRGLKNAGALTLESEIRNAGGETVAASRQPVSELGEEGEWKMEGRFSPGTVYQITIRASGEGNVRFNGSEEEDGFHPALRWSKKTVSPYGTQLYWAAGFLLFALFPVPGPRGSRGRVRWLLAMGGLTMLSVFWFMQTLGSPWAYSMEESTLMAWGLHFGAWIYLGVMGKLLFGSPMAFEKKAAVAVLMMGVLFLFAMTPNSIPDESVHYNRSYGVSNYLLFQQEKAVGDARDYDLDTWKEHVNSGDGYTQVVKRLFEKRSENGTQVYWVPTSFDYPLMYLPQGIGIALGRLLRANTLTLYYLGRLFNLLFYSLCVYGAVKAVPRKKELFFGIGLMPMAIQQAASYSYDAFTNGMALLWTAMALRAVWTERPMGKRDYAALIVVGGLMAPSKVGYIVLAGLLFLIPRKRFIQGRKPLSVGGIILAMAAITALFWLPNALNGSAVIRSGEDVYTVQEIFRQPFVVLRTLFYSVEENMPEWLVEAVGFVFSGYSLWILIYIPVVYLILLAALAQRKDREAGTGFSRRGRAGLMAIIALGVVMIELAELLSWTPVGSERVIGIQGRYFIPLIPVLFLALEMKSIRRSEESDDRKYAWALVFLHVLTVDHILIQTMRGL